MKSHTDATTIRHFSEGRTTSDRHHEILDVLMRCCWEFGPHDPRTVFSRWRVEQLLGDLQKYEDEHATPHDGR